MSFDFKLSDEQMDVVKKYYIPMLACVGIAAMTMPANHMNMRRAEQLYKVGAMTEREYHRWRRKATPNNRLKMNGEHMKRKRTWER